MELDSKFENVPNRSLYKYLSKLTSMQFKYFYCIFVHCWANHKSFISDKNFLNLWLELNQLCYDVNESFPEQCNNEEINIYCGVKKRHKKQFKRDKKDYEKLSEHIGLIPLVMISPSDEELIHGGSEERRKFIDGFISQYNKKYLQSLLSYKKILEQRNSMLKELQNDGLLFDVIEEQMSVLGVYIHQERKKFIEQFLPIFQDFHQTISSGKEVVQLEYKSQLGNGEELSTLLKATRERDFILGYTSKGIHKDDLEMTLDSMPIKRTGSQGQNKTFLIALKLSQFNLLEKISGKRPILLFDDMFDKLDKQRAEKIISILGGNQLGQIFISDTDRVSLPTILDESSYKYKLFTVESGEISLK